MANDLLLEIGLEELPARFVRAAMEQLKDNMDKWLREARLAFTRIDAYATPRRLAVVVTGLADKQEDVQEEVRGPARHIALDESGAWTKAAHGFARSQGVSPDELFLKTWQNTEYVFAVKKNAGQETASVLPEALKAIVTSLHFPKSMRWGDHDLRYARPIRWLVALYGSDIVPFEIAGVRSGNVTRGHRFLGDEAAIGHASEYVDLLKRQHVYADVDERKSMIVDQIRKLAEQRGWTVPIDEDLLEEVLFLVEYPTVLFGQFEPEFLDIPQEVLITSMREHQRYFPVLDDGGKLMPYFVTVRNGGEESLDVVAKGNEKVLRARLSDAKFFYQEDQKLKIDTALAKLEKVVFHEELGTMGDKTRRIRHNAERIARLFGVDGQDLAHVDRAAAICKFDLVTQMVYEFPELQGVMGQDYARKAGEPEPVARAVFEHYQPRFAGDAAPASTVGAIVSIADKIDTIAGCFAIGIVPTGSQDPYALRRQAAGIVQILLEQKPPLGLSELFAIALDALKAAQVLKRSEDDILRDLFAFFELRIKHVLQESARYDVADACLAAGFDRVPSTVRRCAALTAFLERQDAKTAIESLIRVSNLAAKAETRDIDPSRFSDDAERELHDAFQRVRPQVAARMEAGEEHAALELLAELREPINRFFDAVMVMADDAAVRDNRLALLAGIADMTSAFADFRKLVL